jgi:hypothetical protein
LARILDRVRQHLALPWTTDAGGDFHLYVAELPGWPVDVVTPAVKRLVEADPEALAVVVCPDEAGQGPFVAAAGADVVLDLRALLKDRPDLEARGGGASSWVSGRTGQARATAWIKALRS